MGPWITFVGVLTAGVMACVGDVTTSRGKLATMIDIGKYYIVHIELFCKVLLYS